ncbi:hypothetical protein ERO13_D06G061833v2 [Gossypium hirsutum]|uniref:Uncharacterized protein n=1 Tax=Gossypium darwinii TaxID=34276 RepID=A0A5D2C6S6_GOSDA|nr:hypothetical protein ERO13_D06G061833v2 [Gossypium hirsutum]TYG64045.1 hypothetical protein ES288_D06G077700v1 [Gossypium darwinii]
MLNIKESTVSMKKKGLFSAPLVKLKSPHGTLLICYMLIKYTITILYASQTTETTTKDSKKSRRKKVKDMGGEGSSRRSRTTQESDSLSETRSLISCDSEFVEGEASLQKKDSLSQGSGSKTQKSKGRNKRSLLQKYRYHCNSAKISKIYNHVLNK